MSSLVAVISGGGGGMGRAQAIELCKAGYKAILLDRRTDKLEAVQALIGGDHCHIIPNSDIGDPKTWEQAAAMVATLTGGGGELHFLGNTAGGVGSGDFMEIEKGKYETTAVEALIKYNTAYITGVQLSYHYLAPLLAKGAKSTGKPSIVMNISSVAAVLGRAGMSLCPQYGVAKAAVNAITRAAHGLYQDDNILSFGLNNLIYDSEIAREGWDIRSSLPIEEAVKIFHPFPIVGNVADVGELTAKLCCSNDDDDGRPFLEPGCNYLMQPMDPAFLGGKEAESKKSMSMLYSSALHLASTDADGSLSDNLFRDMVQVPQAWTHEGKEFTADQLSAFHEVAKKAIQNAS